MKLKDLGKASLFLNIAKISEYLGLEKSTLSQRIARGRPEITKEEAQKIRRLFRDIMNTK